MRASRLIVSLVLTLLPINLACAQVFDQASLYSRVERSILIKEPRWTLNKKSVAPTDRVAIYRWSLGARSVYAFIYLFASSDDASSEFRQFAKVSEADGLKMKVLGPNVFRVGDEDYLYQDVNDRRNRGVVFRSGAVIVRLSARSFEEAKRFARRLVDAIGAS